VKTKPKKEWKPKDVVSNTLYFPTKVVVDSAAGSPKQTLPESDVVLDVPTYVDQPDQYVETIQEYESESTSKDERCQSKKVIDNGKEEKTFCDENKNSASIDSKKFASDGKEQKLSDGGRSECASEEDNASKDGKLVSEKDESGLGNFVYTIGTKTKFHLDSYISSYFSL
jgi:hypothetical protein